MFFSNESRLTTEIYSYLGTFSITGDSLGFGGCMKKTGEDENYLYFIFDFPKQSNKELSFSKKTVIAVAGDDYMILHRFITSIHLLMYYRLETMRCDKILFDTEFWNDQALSFVMHSSSGSCGYAIGGYMYPWAKKQLASLSKEDLEKLRQYVHEELKRFCLYISGQEAYCEQLNFTNEMWFIQCSMGGRWVSYLKSRDMDKPDEFSSHNIDHSQDQYVLFASIVAMNTFLREKAKSS